MRSRLGLTELTIVYKMPWLWHFAWHEQQTQNTPLEMVLCDGAVASRKRLIVCHQPQDDTHFDMVYDPMSLWRSMCGRLTKIMESGAPVESLEIWLDREDFKQQPIEYAEVTDLRSAEDAEFVNFIKDLEWQKPYWILPLRQIKSLKDLRFKLHNASEPLSQQSRPVEPLPVVGLEAFLRQQMGIPEP